MNVRKSRAMLFSLIFILVILLVLSVRAVVTSVNANSYIYQIRVLEVTDTGASELSSLISGMSNVKLNTLSMKRFVAQRDDIDGKYDMIYIGKGTYSTSGVSSKPTDSQALRASAHASSGVMNDITTLKAGEIVKYYIDKGLLVMFNNQPFDTQTESQRGILYNTFNKYRKAPVSKTNVVFVNSSDLTGWVDALKNGKSPYVSTLHQRPRLTVTNKDAIVDYTVDQNRIYRPGDKLTFNFTVSNVDNFTSRPILAKLYVSVDKSVPVTESQVVELKTLNTGPNGSISYTLPNTLSGLLYWKLEITDHLKQTKLKDYDSGTIRFRGKQTVVNILQVLPTISSSERTSSLLDQNNMDPSFLKTDDYQLNITTKSITEFNNYVAAQYTLDKTYGLNGVYDMLIFGFRDTYNTNAAISNLASEAVVNFTQFTKQSVMFTHDTIYRADSSWVKYFKEITGQVEPLTNLGLSAPNTSRTVAPVNDGLLTQFPFYLSSVDSNNVQKNIITPAIANTHNQYYTLNLEDPTVIPWYNITGSNRDVNDSWNHYYTYSKGNVTYSGTGHVFVANSTEKFPVWEQKLFVNTMYRAYIGSNHKPEITVNVPRENDVIPTYQNEITIDYKVEDPDLYDREVYTTIRFKSGDTYLTSTGMAEKAVLSGKTVHQTFTNPLPEGGKLTVEISARDKQGALADTKTIQLTILKANANLELSRALSSNVSPEGIVNKNETFTVTYVIQPKPVPFDQLGAADQAASSQVISDIEFQETLPANLEPTEGWPDGITASGNKDSGYILSKPLGSIKYTLKTVNGVKAYVPVSSDPISFSIKVKATITGSYNLDDGRVSFIDIHADPDALPTATPLPSPSPSATASAVPAFNPSVSSSGSALGFAGDYNALVFGDAKVTATVQGNLAVKGNTTTSGVAINESLGSTVPYAIVTGGNLNFQNGSVYGNILHQGTYNKVDSGTIVNGTYARGSLIDFNTSEAYYQNLSNQLAALTPNGTQELMYGGMYLYGKGTGKDSLVNFTISSEEFGKAGWANVENLSGKNMVYTFTGSEVIVNKVFGLPQGVTGGDHVIYNFPNATKVSISGVDLRGSVLAPNAAVTFTNGQIHGNVIAKSLDSSSLLALLPYKGPLPVTPPAATPTIAPTPTSSPTASPVPSANPLTRTYIKFPVKVLTVIDRITGLKVEDATLLIGDEQLMPWTIEPANKSNEPLTWSSSDSTVVSVSSSGIVTGLKSSKDPVIITATTTDGSNLSDTAAVTVLNPLLNLTGNESAKVNETVEFTAVYSQSKESDKHYSWTTVNKATGEPVAAITPDASNPAEAEFKIGQIGSYTISVLVTTLQNPAGITATKDITVGLNGVSISGPAQLYRSDSKTFTAITDPLNPGVANYEWSLADANDLQYGGFVNAEGRTVASLTTTGSTVEFKGTNVTEGIHIIVKAAGLTSSTYPIKVLEEPGLMFNPNSGFTTLGGKVELLPNLYTDSFEFVPESIVSRLQWSVIGGNASAIDLTSKGVVTGLNPTQPDQPVQIQVKYQTISGQDKTAVYTLIVNGPTGSGDNRY